MGFRPLSELLTDNFVVLLVGSDLKPYHVHRDVICDRSAHFRAALQGHFQEAHTGRLEFPEDEPTTFELFIRWLYGSTHRQILTDEQLHHYVSLMCFAQRILSTELHNDCMDSIRHHFYLKAEQGPSWRVMTYPNSGVVSVSDVALAYAALPKLPDLRFCLCLELALHVKKLSEHGVTAWMSADLSQLLQDGGDFAADFPKLLVYCIASKSYLGTTLAANYNWMFHIGGSRAAASGCIWKNGSWEQDITSSIEQAAVIFNGKIDQQKTMDNSEKPAHGFGPWMIDQQKTMDNSEKPADIFGLSKIDQQKTMDNSEKPADIFGFSKIDQQKTMDNSETLADRFGPWMIDQQKTMDNSEKPATITGSSECPNLFAKWGSP
ncbi:MAG: hypothetical protein Q9223_006351 [Gallowayella weberi]